MGPPSVANAIEEWKLNLRPTLIWHAGTMFPSVAFAHLIEEAPAPLSDGCAIA